MYQTLIASLLVLSTAARAQEVVTVCRATDLAAPSGSLDQDILIQIVPDEGLTKRQSATYLSSDGETDPDCAQGSSFRLIAGKLYTEGQTYSTSGNVSSELFTTAKSNRGIDRIFGVTESVLFWDNRAFDSRTARFCLDASNKVQAVYKGSLPAGCTPALLQTVPVSICVRRPSSTSASSNASSTPSAIPSFTLPSASNLTSSTRTPSPPSSLSNSAASSSPISVPTNGTLSYSSPTLRSSDISPTNTFDAVDQASLLIVNGALGRFCSEYLGYNELTRTATETGSAATTVTANIEGTGQQSILTVIRTQTEGNVITRTSTPTVTKVFTQTELVTTVRGTTTIVVTDEVAYRSGDAPQSQSKEPKLKKRAPEPTIPVPELLATFAPDVISSACSENVVEPTNRRTVTTKILSTAFTTLQGTASRGLNTIYSNYTVQDNSTTYISGRPYTINGTRVVTSTVRQTASATSTVTASTPELFLADPTPLAGSLNASNITLDGDSFNIALANGTVQIYDKNSTDLRVSLDGVLSLDADPGCPENYPEGSSYENVELPTRELDPANCAIPPAVGYDILPPYSVAAFWDDLVLSEGSPGGVWYQEDDGAIYVEFLLQSYEDNYTNVHFLWGYRYDEPGISNILYLTADDGAISATIGVQGDYTDYLQYSHNETVISEGFFSISLNTVNNTYESSSDVVPASFKKST